MIRHTHALTRFGDALYVSVIERLTKGISKTAAVISLFWLVFGICQASTHGQNHRVGTVLWSWKNANTWSTLAPAVGSNGIVYLGTLGTFSAFDANNGSNLWNFSTNGWMLSQTTVGPDGTVYLGAGSMHAFDGVHGTIKWTFTNTAGFSSIPALDPDGTLFAACRNGVLYAVMSNNSRT
jgi:outer membrane protein assembly factor BamB